MNNSDWNFTEFCGLYYKNYDGVIMTLYTSKETSMNARLRNLHSSVRRRKHAVVIFIIQATGHWFNAERVNINKLKINLFKSI